MPPISTSFLGKTGLSRLAAPALAPSRVVTCMAKKKGESSERERVWLPAHARPRAGGARWACLLPVGR